MFGKVAQEEGVAALQKGLVPSLLRETFYSSIRLSAYEPLRDVIMTDAEKSNSSAPFLKKFAAGATAGAIGAGLARLLWFFIVLFWGALKMVTLESDPIHPLQAMSREGGQPAQHVLC